MSHLEDKYILLYKSCIVLFFGRAKNNGDIRYPRDTFISVFYGIIGLISSKDKDRRSLFFFLKKKRYRKHGVYILYPAKQV
jgi:hypothetical protein